MLTLGFNVRKQVNFISLPFVSWIWYDSYFYFFYCLTSVFHFFIKKYIIATITFGPLPSTLFPHTPSARAEISDQLQREVMWASTVFTLSAPKYQKFKLWLSVNTFLFPNKTHTQNKWNNRLKFSGKKNLWINTVMNVNDPVNDSYAVELRREHFHVPSPVTLSFSVPMLISSSSAEKRTLSPSALRTSNLWHWASTVSEPEERGRMERSTVTSEHTG